jgi:HK97 family phage portal protein
VSTEVVLRNMAVFRCCDLISASIGMLPIYLTRKLPDGTIQRAEDHPLYDMLLSEPNNWQTAYEFKSQMQLNALTEGDAYARIIWSGKRILALIPLEPRQVTPIQNDDWTVSYRYNRPSGGQITLDPDEVFHLRDMSRNGITGLARTKMAKEAIGLALQAEKAAAKLFQNGLMMGVVRSTPARLSDPAWERLKADVDEREGSDQAQRTMILEEGLSAAKLAMNATDAQMIEARKHQVEEVSRAFGVPRPLLMMD